MYLFAMEPGGIRPSKPQFTKAKSALLAAIFFIYNAFVSHLPSYSLRRLYLSSILRVKIGKGVAIHMGCFVTGRLLSIGDHSVINRNCYLDGRAGMRIGSNVSISPECYLISLTHDPRDPDFAARPGPVVVGDYAWLGARAMVMPGVTLGEGAVVGAGSVVTKSCEPYAILAGSPARKLGERPKGLRYRLSYFPLFNTDIQA